MRLSDYRLSYAMKDLLVGVVTGAIHRGSACFGAATAEALHKRGLLDAGYRPTDIGRQVASEIVARMPKQFAEPKLSRLIAGLQIFQRYEPHSHTYPVGNRGRIALQEEAFEDISEEDRMTLKDLGWEQTAPFEWVFWE